MKLDKDIVRKILNTVKAHSVYGFKLLSYLKESSPELNETVLYATLKQIESLELVEPYISSLDKVCKVNIRYRLSQKGEDYLIEKASFIDGQA